MYNKTQPIVGVAFGMLAASGALAEHLDIYVTIDGSALTTSGIDLDTNDVTPGLRVFEAELGEIPAPPGFGDEPGFVAAALTQGTAIGFNFVDGLRSWNGSDFDTLAAETFTMSKGLDSVIAPNSAGGFAAGFALGVADVDGDIHDHAEFELSPGTNVGIYLVTLQMWTDAPGIGNSSSIWIVFNNGMDEEDHEAAVEWVESNLVPAPSAAMLLLATAPIAARRRR